MRCVLLTDFDSRDPLKWLSEILWPEQAVTIESGTIGRSGQDKDRPFSAASPQWWASPSADQPRILIPSGSKAAARAAVKRYHDGFSIKRRLRSAAAEAIMVNGRTAGLILRRNQVGARWSSGDLDGSAPLPDGAGVLHWIQDLMDMPEMHVAVSLSTPKSNQKPVLQLLDGSGRCHGWAKVAWNDRTDALVGNEAYWLQRRSLPPLSMPTLLHDVRLAGRRVVITSTMETGRIPRRKPTKLPDLDLLRSVTALGSVDTTRIKDSPWWLSVEKVLDHATTRERAAMQAAADSCYRLQFRVGAWHGDLTPWNLMTTRNGSNLIDWEFAADGVPIGFDLCHFHTQIGSEMRGYDAAAALDYSARLTPQGLSRLGVDAENRTAVWRLYLVELLRRLLVLRADGYPIENVTQGPAALLRLERSMGLVGIYPPDPPAGMPATERRSDPQSTREPSAAELLAADPFGPQRRNGTGASTR